MPDARTLPRLLDELVSTLRRNGFIVAPPQVLDLLRAVRALGWDDPGAVREAAAAIVVERTRDRPRFDAVFTAFFARSGPSPGLWGRLRAQGFMEAELGPLRELLDAMAHATAGGESFLRLGALLEGRFELDRLLQLAGVRRELDALSSPLQVGFFTQRVAEAVGLRDARGRLAQLRSPLRDALGARGDALVDALTPQSWIVRTTTSAIISQRRAR